MGWMQRRPRPTRRLQLLLVALPALAFLTAQIVLAAPPNASFTISDSTAVRGQEITFVASATDDDGDTIVSYEWAFGDGATASGPNVSHAYTELGAKNVTLKVTDSANETTTVPGQVTVENRPPTASFTVSDPAPVRGQSISFNATASDPDGDTPLSYAWDFGDGTRANGQNVTHAYPAGTSLGAKTVTLTVTDAANGTRVVNQQVTVQNAPPSASFTVSDPTPARGQSVTFNATATDPDGEIASYEWTFGDGSTATGQNVSHTYPANTTLGAKNVTLTVTDAADATTVETQQVTVQNALPNPVISVSDTTPDIGQTVNFNGSASSDFEGPISDTNHDWDLDGNGSFESTGKTPSRSYSTPGPVTVRLQVMDTNGATQIATQVITVNGNVTPTAVPAISHEDEPGGTPGIDVGETVTFDGSPSTAGEPGDTITKYEWDLDGNGTFERTGRTHTRTYSTAGTVTVTLRVTDAGGATHSASETITVITNNPPTARLAVSHVDQPEGTAGVDVGEAVNFNGSGSDAGGDPNDAIARYEWDLDGNPSTGADGFELNTGTTATASRSYSTTGPLTVRLRVTDSKGAAHTASQAITVSNTPPVARFTISGAAANAVANAGDAVNFNATSASPGESSDTITLYEWDLDGNDTFETQGQTASRSYTTPGPLDVKLRVTDRAGATHVASTPDLRINARPVARIGIVNAQAETGQKPTVPLAGQPFQFTAGAVSATAGAPPAPGCPASAVTPASPASSDFEAPIAAYQWDLDGNGQFNDGTGQTVSVAGYPADPSPRTVGLRVVDSDGASHSTTLTFRVNRPPAPDFVLEPLTPVINQQVTFSTTSGDPDDADTTLTHSWDLDGDGTFCETGEQGPSVRRAFTSAGAKKVRLRVTDTGGVTREVTRDVLIQNTIPNGSISFSPDAPLPGQAVTFVGSGSSPTNKPIKPLAWNFDFDAAGFDPASTQFPAHATGASVTWSFPTPGPRTVALKVSEEGGGFRIVTGTIVVNAPPSASFSVSDASPFTGVPVTISSTSQDPDGPLAGQQWDLDNDGQFDDASGPVAFASFATPGVRRVSLRVTDTRGATSTAVRDVTVRAVPPPPPPPPPQPPQLLQGVVVRIKGSVLGAYTKVKRLLVRAPKGANVLVRCRGKSCPKKAGRASRLSKGGQLRFKQLERRLRAGTRITVQVTQPGFVGRVTRFGMRKKAAPKRADLCLPPGAKRPAACPGW
jgi:PKD repeat protein